MLAEGADTSSIAIASLKEKISALFIDLYNARQDVTSTSPEFLIESIETIFHQINQSIFLRNQTQGLDRYGVSAVLALCFARPNVSSAGFPDGQIVHEIYLVHVGDCRAYWLTSKSCHQLTLDDSYANLEISRGHSTDREMLNHPVAKALTQFLGSQIDCFKPNIQRLIFREDGVLMLCSRGLSDNNLVDQSWKTFMQGFFQGHLSLQDTAQNWLTFATEKNGYTNKSLVLIKLIYEAISTSPRL